MVKRLLNCYASDFRAMTAQDLKQSILASEGRTILSENICSRDPQAMDVTNSEVARALGADIILLNALDLQHPYIGGLPETDEPIKTLKTLVGRPVGVNLEPVDDHAEMAEEVIDISPGRQANETTLKKANDMGFDFICLTGNPGTGVTNKAIADTVALAKKTFNGLIIAGKMHGAGVSESVLNMDAINQFIDAGADIILLPAVGTIPGITQEDMVEAVRTIKSKGPLVMSAIGTSQESADVDTVRDIALMNKIAGVDIQHIGDSGYGGLAPYENILAMSNTIRGARHTLRMISGSINR